MNKSEIDLTLRLHASADLCEAGDLPDTSVLAEVQRLAADEIERLRKIITESKAVAAIEASNDPRVGMPAESYADRINRLDASIAALESSVRLHTYRLDAVRESMRECATKDGLHNSVRYLADTLAINLGSNPAPTAMAAYEALSNEQQADRATLKPGWIGWACGVIRSLRAEWAADEDRSIDEWSDRHPELATRVREALGEDAHKSEAK